MSGWHPVTKAALALGPIAIAALLLTDGGGGVVAPAQDPGTSRAELPTADRMELPSFGTLGFLPPVEAFEAMVERPLFAPSRRAYVEAAPVLVEETYEPAADEPLEPGIVFIGTVRRGDAVLALVNGQNGGGVETLRIGAEVNGWQVLSIDDRSLELGQAGERRSLAMFETAGGGASTPGGYDAGAPPDDEGYWDAPDPDVDG